MRSEDGRFRHPGSVMSNPFDLLFLDEDGTPMAAVVSKKTAQTAAVTAPKAAAKSQTESASGKGRMEGERKGKKPASNGQIEDASGLPEKANRGIPHRGGRQAARNVAPRKDDRHSRSGPREGGEKRQYGGRGNWGNPADPAEAVAEAQEPVVNAAEESTEAAAAAVEEEKPTGPALMTLAQFLAEQEKKKPAVAAPAARAANDGAAVSGEVVKKTDDLYFQTQFAKAAVKSVKAPKTKAATTFSLQQLNAALPGGLARPPRPAREENGKPQRDARRSENGKAKPAAAEKAVHVKTANLKDSSAFPTL